MYGRDGMEGWWVNGSVGCSDIIKQSHISSRVYQKRITVKPISLAKATKSHKCDQRFSIVFLLDSIFLEW